MPDLTPADAIDQFGFPVYSARYAAAEAKAQRRKRLDIVKHLSLASLADVIKSAIGSAVGVAGAATKAIGAVSSAGLEATAPLGAGYAGANFGIGLGVGEADSALRSRTPPLNNYAQIETIAMNFLDEAIRALPCIEPPVLKGNTESARLSEKQQAKSSASAIAKEAAHQMDMLGRAWDQLAEVAEKPVNADRAGTPKWRKCRIASEVAGGMAWFQRKYNKATYFHEKLIEDYCAVGGVFTVMEQFWRASANEVVVKALVASVRLGARERMGDLPQNPALKAEALRRIVGGAAATGHISAGTTTWRG